MKHLVCLFACFAVSSCNIYNSSFDCPPGKGIGCASVGEVLDLIVEREEEEDLFVYDRGTALILKQQEKLKNEEKSSTPRPKTKPKLMLVQQDSGKLILVEEMDP